MADTTVAYGISADASGFEKGMQQAAESAKAAAGQIDGHFKKVQDAFAGVQKQLLMLAAVVAGGAYFKAAIDKSNELTGEVTMLSKALGVSRQDASTLNVALRAIGSSADTYTQSNAKLTKQIRTNEEGVKAMGVQTRSANGELLSGQAIMTNAITALKGYKEGTDRNLAAQTLFGKGAGEVTALLKLNNEVMDKAAITARELGMVMGPEQAANTKAYKDGMKQVGLVLDAVENQVGQAVMPTFTKLAEWFAATGPALIQTFRPAMQAVSDVFSLVIDVARELGSMIKDVFLGIGSIITSVAGEDTPGALAVWTNAMIIVRVAALGLKEGIVLAFEIIRGAILVVVEEIKGFAGVARAAFSLDWGGVKAAWAGGVQGVEKVLADSQKRILEKTAATAEQMQRVLMGGPLDAPNSPEAAAPASTKLYEDPKAGKDGKEKSRTSEWETELAEKKAAIARESMEEGRLRELSKAEELRYWQDIKAMAGLSTAERLTVSKKAAEVEMSLVKESFEQKVRVLESEAASYKHNTEKRLELERQIQAKYTEGTKGYEESQKRINDIQRQATEQSKAIELLRSQGVRDANLAELQGREQMAALDLQLNNISKQQLLAKQSEFENQKSAIMLDGLKERERIALASPDTNVVELEKIHQEIQQLERQHQQKLAEIRGQAVLEQNRDALNLQHTLRAGFENSIAGMLQGTMTLQKGLQAVWTSMLQGFSQFISKKVTAWALGETAQTGATVVGNTTRATSDWMAATQSVIASAWAGAKNIAMKAWEVAANVYAAIAGIPYVGPFLAPVMAVAAAGTVMGYASHMASAAGGYDIPGSVNPITQLHAREMVLPAKHADVIRSLADNRPDDSGGGGGGGDLTVNITAMDGHDVRRVLMNNTDALVASMKKARRDFQA